MHPLGPESASKANGHERFARVARQPGYDDSWQTQRLHEYDPSAHVEKPTGALFGALSTAVALLEFYGKVVPW